MGIINIYRDVDDGLREGYLLNPSTGHSLVYFAGLSESPRVEFSMFRLGNYPHDKTSFGKRSMFASTILKGISHEEFERTYRAVFWRIGGRNNQSKAIDTMDEIGFVGTISA